MNRKPIHRAGIHESTPRHISFNSVSAISLGVTAMQWALEKTPTGIVTAIIAMTPVVLLPMTRVVDGEKIGMRSLAGAFIGVAGVIGLAFWK